MGLSAKAKHALKGSLGFHAGNEVIKLLDFVADHLPEDKPEAPAEPEAPADPEPEPAAPAEPEAQPAQASEPVEPEAAASDAEPAS